MNGYSWRLLEAGEVCVADDQYLSEKAGDWRELGAPGRVIAKSTPTDCIVRRRVPFWPAPRDAKTDPPKESDCDGAQCILAFIDGVWIRTTRLNAIHVAAPWIPLPPLPPLPQSDSEKAWEAYCAMHGTPVSGISKDMFIRGFNAGKGSK